MKVIIAGSRTIHDYETVRAAAKRSGFEITEVVSGGAQGVDLIGEKYAREIGVEVKSFPANWEKFPRAAGIIRNRLMASYADALIAVWDGKSKGTKHMIDEMRDHQHKPIFVVDGRQATV